jgi:hypothetical protein
MSLIIARAFATMALVMVLTPATGESFNQPLQGQDMSQSGDPAQVPGVDSKESGDTGKGPAISGARIGSSKPAVQEKPLNDPSHAKLAPYTTGPGKEWPDLRKSGPATPPKT